MIIHTIEKNEHLEKTAEYYQCYNCNRKFKTEEEAKNCDCTKEIKNG